MTLLRLTLGALTAVALIAQTRFDYVVRGDFFLGFTGNANALQRGRETTEKVLAEDPNHAEALVWHGSGTMFQAGQEFQKGNTQRGMELFQRGVEETDRAVQLSPDKVGVRIPRGSTLIGTVRVMGDNPMRPALLERARDDFQHSFDLQEQRLDQLGTHPLGELLQNLGDIYSRLGDVEKAAKYYGMLQARLPGTEYARRAAEWMKTRQTLPAAQAQCVGCHTSNR